MLIAFCVLFCLTLVHGAHAACSATADSACSCNQLKVEYGSIDVKCGQKLDKSKAVNAPKVKLSSAKSDKKYLILMVDPDAPNSGTGKAWIHWLVEAEGSMLKNGKVGNAHVKYAGPTPPSGTHNYIFFVLEYNKQKIEKVTERGKFPFADFISSHGTLVAANKFLVSA